MVVTGRQDASAQPGRLTGKRAIVIGASGADNIGQAIARRFADEKAEIIVAARSLTQLEDFAREIGGRAIGCDIVDESSVAALFAAAGETVDIVVNAVGRNLFRPLMETTRDDVEELAEAHLVGPLLVMQAARRAMGPGGSIVQISSLTARLVMKDHVAYMATKAAGEVLIQAAALEFGPAGIRVNGIAPALTRTPMTEGFFGDAELVRTTTQAAPLRRLGTPRDVADAALWLVGDECFVTGEILQVNGGMAMHSILI